MAELDTAKRDRLHDSSFAYIDREGERHLPINDDEPRPERDLAVRPDRLREHDREARRGSEDPRRGEAPRHRRRRRVGRRPRLEALTRQAAATVTRVRMYVWPIAPQTIDRVRHASQP